MLWILEGDRKSKFFDSSVKIRHHKNKMHAIKDSSCIIFTEHSGLKTIFFISIKLFGTPLPILMWISLFKAIPDDFVVLKDGDRVDLIRLISKWEVFFIKRSILSLVEKVRALMALTVISTFSIGTFWETIFFKAVSYFFQTYNPPPP